MEWLIGFIVVLFAASAIFGWFSDKSKSLKEDEYNRNLRQQLLDQKQHLLDQKHRFESEMAKRTQELENRAGFKEDEYNRNLRQQLLDQKQKLESEMAELTKQFEKRAELVGGLRREFSAGYVCGRKWLAAFIAEADRALDDSISLNLKYKKRPAPKSSNEVSEARAERRAFKERVKFLEYQLKSYKEYFPFLDDYEELILDEAVSLSSTANNLEALDDADPVLLYVPKADYDQLSTTERNQLALDRYLSRTLSPTAVGRLYERYLGYLHEQEGWKVEYHGIIERYEDLGRDLICTKDNDVLIIQAKCWSKQKLIHEKHIFQLFGTTQLYLMNRAASELFSPDVSAWFITTTNLSPVAQKTADWLKIQVKEGFELSKTYPMIKCNINQVTKAKIYHLPFDQMYDRTKIVPAWGEFYAQSVADAEEEGFRRAWRHTGPFVS